MKSAPPTLAAAADTVLWTAGCLGRTRASTGYETETDGTTVYVHHHTGRERDSHPLHLDVYARSLQAAGYTSPEGDTLVAVHSPDHRVARVEAPPPAKQAAYGGARFSDDLPAAEQLEIIEIQESWARHPQPPTAPAQ